MFSRNIGLISKEDQKKLKKSTILICGVGGMGGVCAESLVRMGVHQLIIIDHDKYEESNINRQIHCTSQNLNEYKSLEVKKRLIEINPKVKIKAINKPMTKKIIKKILKNYKIDLVVNGMDDMLASIILERNVRKNKLTLVDAWITPYPSVFVIKPTDPHWEEYLNLPTKDKKIKDITKEDLEKSLELEIKHTLSFFKPYEIISKNKVDKIIKKEIPRPSFLPVVWISGVLMANEVYKILTKKQDVASHKGIFYNQYTHEVINNK